MVGLRTSQGFPVAETALGGQIALFLDGFIGFKPQVLINGLAGFVVLDTEVVEAEADVVEGVGGVGEAVVGVGGHW
jgi:hypothetical protein